MAQLVEDELEPDLGRLVLDDEQDLVVGVGARVLGAEDGVEMQVLAVAELALHLQVGAFKVGATGHRSSFRMPPHDGSRRAPRRSPRGPWPPGVDARPAVAPPRTGTVENDTSS